MRQFQSPWVESMVSWMGVQLCVPQSPTGMSWEPGYLNPFQLGLRPINVRGGIGARPAPAAKAFEPRSSQVTPPPSSFRCPEIKKLSPIFFIVLKEPQETWLHKVGLNLRAIWCALSMADAKQKLPLTKYLNLPGKLMHQNPLPFLEWDKFWSRKRVLQWSS